MFVADQIVLMLFALAGCGLLACFSPVLIGPQKVSLGPLWLTSIASFSISFLFFAAIPVVDPIIQTAANFFTLVSFAFTALLFRSWRVQITRNLNVSVWASLVICAMLYEQLRLQSDYNVRVAYMSCLIMFFLLWQACELIHSLRKQRSRLLWVIFLLTVLQLSTILGRSISQALEASVLATSILSEDMAPRLWRWLSITINCLRFFLIGAYFLDKKMTEQSELFNNIALSEKRLAIELQDKQALRHLLSERDALLSALLVAKKTAEVGTLFNLLRHQLKRLSYDMQSTTSLLHKALALSQEDETHQPQARLIGRILSANQRAINIITTLQIIVLKTPSSPERLDLAIYIESKKTLFLTLLGQKHISFDIQHDQLNAIDVSVHPQEFESALVNILNRTITAFESSPTTSRRVLFEIKRTETHAQLIIMDNAGALESGGLNSLVPSLPSNQHSNVDLWLSQHVIKKYGGRIWFANRPNWSTALLIELPLALHVPDHPLSQV
jgi:hypothetical protein